MTSSALAILDDASGQIKFGGGDWTLSSLVQWYRGTSYYPAFVDGTKKGDLYLSFEGTSAAFIGNTPDSRFSQSATVSIDGSPSYNITYRDLTPPSYVQWYQTPTLDDKEHTISIGGIDGTALDMVLISVGPNTSLTGKTLFVDNEDAQIVYDGKWKENSDRFNAGQLPDGNAIFNSTHQSSTVGDTATFRFTGTSISVYGIFSWANIGSLMASYSLDGTIDVQTYPVTASTPNYIKNDGEASNFLLYSTSDLSPTTHTLTITITESRNIAYRLDYITYTPSFANLASMPTLPPLSMTTSGSVPSSSSNVAPVHARSTKILVGPIVGGVLGGVLVVLLVIILLWLRRRKQLRESYRDDTEPAYPPVQDSSRGVIYPFNPSMEQVVVHDHASQSLGPASGDPRMIYPYTHRDSLHSRSTFTDPKGSRAGPSFQDTYNSFHTSSPAFSPATRDPAVVSPYLHINTAHVQTTPDQTKSRGEAVGGPSLSQLPSQNRASSSMNSIASLGASSLPNEPQSPPAYDALSLYLEHDTPRRTS